MKYLFLIILVLLSLPTWSQVKNIVFNVEGTLVQSIPARNYNAFTKKDQMISINVGGQNRFFYIYPYSVALIEYLQQRSDYLVHYSTNKDKVWIELLLKAIKLKNKDSNLWGPVEKGTSKVLTSAQIKDGKTDLSSISGDLTNTLFVTSYPETLIPEQKENEFFIGQNFYYFEQWKEVEAEIAKKDANVIKNLPTSEDEWFTEQNKIAFLFQVLTKANLVKATPLTKSVSKLTLNRSQVTKEGMAIAGFDFIERDTKYKFSQNKLKIIGCGLYDNLKKIYLQDKPIADCMAKFTYQYEFRIEPELSVVNGCEIVDEKSKAFIVSAPMEKCFDANSKKIHSHYEGKTKTACGQYISGNFIKKMPLTSCGGTHIFCSQRPTRICNVVETFEGIEKESLEDILNLAWIPRSRFSLFDKNPAPSTSSNNVSLPRVAKTIYRGHDPRYYSKSDAIKAMLGHPYLGIRSKRTAELEAALKGQGKSEKEALNEAIAQTDSEFTPEKVSALINQSQSNYEQWPKHVMYWTSYLPVALTYSKTVIAVESLKPITLDLNYYSAKNGYDWRNGCGSGVDAGEILFPNYVPANEVVGYMTGAGDTRNTVSIVDAIYKIKENGISFAVVLEPKKQQCILRTASNEFKFCVDNFLYTELYPLLPTETDRKVNVCGFYVVCDDRSPTSCGITDAIKNRYSYTNCGEAPIPPSSLEWGDKQIQYFKGSDL